MNEQDWKALARLAATPDGKHLLAILRRRREVCRDRLEQASPDNFGIEQGGAKAYKDMMELIEKAPETVKTRFS